MDQLFIGLLFILLDFNISLGTITIGLLPDFIGYILAFLGLNSLKSESPVLGRCASLAPIFGVFSLFSYLISLLSFITNVYFIYAVGVIEVILRLFFVYQLVKGLEQLESSRNIDLYSGRLHRYWLLMTTFQFFSFFTIASLLSSAVCTIVSFICSILFIFKFNKTRINWKDTVTRYRR